MPGGPSFLRPMEELSTRLCYIDFDGKFELLPNPKPAGLGKSYFNTFNAHVYSSDFGQTRLDNIICGKLFNYIP